MASEEQASPAQVHVEKGLLHYSAGRVSEAVVEFKRALEIDPDNRRAKSCLAWVEKNKKNEIFEQQQTEAKEVVLPTPTEAGERPWNPVPLTPQSHDPTKRNAIDLLRSSVPSSAPKPVPDSLRGPSPSSAPKRIPSSVGRAPSSAPKPSPLSDEPLGSPSSAPKAKPKSGEIGLASTLYALDSASIPVLADADTPLDASQFSLGSLDGSEDEPSIEEEIVIDDETPSRVARDAAVPDIEITTEMEMPPAPPPKRHQSSSTIGARIELLLRNGEIPAAVSAAEEFVAQGGGVVSQSVIAQSDLLCRTFGASLGPSQSLVAIGTISGSLDPRSAFLLSRIDGSIALGDLLEVSGMVPLETLWLLVRLVRDGTVTITMPK